MQLDSRHIKDNKLLNDVFPERIAKQLREGSAVEPEHFDCVTVFFSDIVGFTDISRQLAPEDVMKMLNRLYSEFDAVTRKHGLFKVLSHKKRIITLCYAYEVFCHTHRMCIVSGYARPIPGACSYSL